MNQPVKPAYAGEAMLLRWNDGPGGRTITLLLDENVGEHHPFKAIKYGNARGARMQIVAVLVDESDEPINPPASAKPTPAPQVGTKHEQSPGDEAKEKKRFRELKRSAQAAMMLTKPEFRKWLCNGQIVELVYADAVLKGRLDIESKTELDSEADDSGYAWDRLLDTYEVETKWQR